MVQILTKRPATIRSDDGWTVAGAGPDLLRELLTDYTRTLGRLGLKLQDWMQDGVEPEQATSTLKAAGLGAPEELMVWFSWQNGPRRLANGGTIPPLPLGFVPASLDRSVADYQHKLAEMVPAGLWAPGWLSLQEDPGLAVFCNGPTTSPCLVRVQFEEEYDFVTEFAPYQVVSLCTVVTWWLEALESGAIWRDPESTNWEFDGKKCAEIDHGTLILG